MTTSLYMPDVKVEVAFTSDFSTPAASRVWTDVSSYVELDQFIRITCGRSDARGSCEANSLGLTVDNSDGRFTPGLSSSPYYPNVKLGKPIRVTAKPVGSANTYTRFLGYVDAWPVEWAEGVDAFARSQVTAVSRLARIGRANKMKSGIVTEAMYAGPAHYWTLGDAKGSTKAADSIGTSAATPLVQRGVGSPDVVFGVGTGPGSDGLTAATFATDGRFLRADTGSIAGDFTLTAFYATTDATGAWILGVGNVAVGITTAGKLTIDGPNVAATTDAGTAVNDGLVHHVSLRYTASTGVFECLRDGALACFITDTDTSVATGRVYVGNGVPEDTEAKRNTLNGTISHVGLFHRKLLGIEVDELVNSGDGFLGETASSRFARYSRWGGAVIGDVFADPEAVTPMQAIDSTDKTVAELMRKVEATEGGVLFDNRVGELVYLSRNYRFNRAAGATLPTTAFEAELAPRLDDSELVNRATAQVTDDTTVVATNEVSLDAYGLYDIPFEVLTTVLSEAEGRCWWTVNRFGEPRTRVPNLTIDMLSLTLAQQDALAPLDVGARVATTGSWPTQLGTVLDSGFYLEGFVETLGPESWSITFNVTAANLTEVVELNHATYGLIGSYVLAY